MSENSLSPAIHINANTLLLPAINAWEIYLQDQDKSHFTVKAFISDLLLLSSFLPPDQTIGAITTNDLNNFLNWLQTTRGVPCSPKTLSRRITSLKAFFRWLNQNGRILIDPAEKVVQKTVISPLPTILNKEETLLVLDTANQYRQQTKPDARPYTLLLLLLETGIKKGECLSLSVKHVELEGENSPFIFVRYNNPNYRFKERKIPVSDEWVEVYQEYLAQNDPKDQIFPWSPRRLEYILEDISKDAGIDKHLSFDMCRWTSAIIDYQSGIDHEKIRQKLGISKIQWREVGNKLKKLASIEEEQAD
ncbi:MAG: hypothetical protein CL609_12175 [Anaerolineaceae bacterium]|nr:hypothetical protein [Anaerolineaceae bacterium]